MSLSSDGKTLAVGASGEASANATDEDNNAADNSGAAYLFKYNGTAWEQQAYIKATNTDKGDNFGYSVSLSSDGKTLAVAANGEDSEGTGANSGKESGNGADNSGAIYTY